MKACTKCGRWHNDVEAAAGHRLYCSDIKKFWRFIGERHRQQTGHYARPDIGVDGNWICCQCGQAIDVDKNTLRKWMENRQVHTAECKADQAIASVTAVPDCGKDSL